MKYVKTLSTIIVSTCLLFACSGNSSSLKSNDALAANTSATGTTSTGDASFYCKIDGKEFSSSEKTEMQNVAVNLIGNNKGNVIFSLSDLKQNASGGVDMLSFIVPGQQGSITLTASNSAPGLDDYMSEGMFYVPNPVTVNIISISATKIAGTFSGKYGMPSGAGYSKIVEVTDGKFDIPFSTSQEFIKMRQNTSK